MTNGGTLNYRVRLLRAGQYQKVQRLRRAVVYGLRQSAMALFIGNTTKQDWPLHYRLSADPVVHMITVPPEGQVQMPAGVNMWDYAGIIAQHAPYGLQYKDAMKVGTPQKSSPSGASRSARRTNARDR
jgi:hypothetical protein